MLSGSLVLSACNKSALPLPKMGANESTTSITVPYPPPPARPEIVPPKAGDRVVWIDGAWIWDRRRWVWQRGRWEVPPTGAHYAHAKIVQLPDGTLGWVPGGWQMPNQQSAPAKNN
ncbi:MAG: hypothetical protein IPM54_16310 [Polyangiaceae bacterium]|nr:hypothetical protein [Polyangiaceae bacterium]